ncbi:MAG TPA: type II toxin-antitoxin system RelE/ParE family toxin [bacterium]|nr:type II toxin-antitoxin system RelE/ParE family toxin [bacterium]
MEVKPKDPQFYVDVSGKAHAEDWLNALKDLSAKATIVARLGRIRRGLLGDCERYGAVTELRIDFGPGYRIYTVEDGTVLVVLLCGGDKSDRKKDFKIAKRLADEYHKEKETGAAKFRPLPE